MAEELAYYASKGFNILRLPISWERLQHELSGDLVVAYKTRVAAFVKRANTAGWRVILDLHNYNRYAIGTFDAAGQQVDSYSQHVLGDADLHITHLVDVWTRLATLFKGKPRVMFNIMNEPHDFAITSDNWFAMVQMVIDAIRDAGAKQLILVPNSRGSDVDHWSKYAPNGGSLDSVAALSITDKANNIAFDMHAYQDNPVSPTSYVDLVTPVTQWAIKHRKRLFLSECGVVNGAANGPSAISNLLSYLNAHRSVWVGWTAWNLAPYNLTRVGDYTADGAQMAWYTPYLTPNTV